MNRTKNRSPWGLILLLSLLITSCSDWTEVESIKQKTQRPQEQDPELWAQYTAALKEYKKSDHTLVLASFANGAVSLTSEIGCLRALPDSLDVVLLTNADNFSAYDREDLPVLKEKGTRLVYSVDYVKRAGEFTDLAALSSYLDRVVARVGELNLDGFSFSGIPVYGGTQAEQDAQKAVAALFIEKFAAVAGPGKNLLLIFEGDPQFIAAADRSKIDYFVLDTDFTDNATDLKLQVVRALNASAIPREKLLLGAMTEFEFVDEDKVGSEAIPALTMRVTELGPLGGLCVYDANKDYFGAEIVYPLTRGAIQTLNPSK